MRRSLALLAATLASSAAVLPAGGCSSAGGTSDASADGTVGLPSDDASGDDAEGDGAFGIATRMRLANMSPDLGPVDFCWRVTGAGSFTGPVLGGSLDGGGLAPSADAAADAIEDSAVFDGGDGADRNDAADNLDAADSWGTDGDAMGDEAMSDEAGDATAEDAPASASADGGALADSGIPPQVSFGSISPFEQLPVAGTLDIALVGANQLSCGEPRFVGQVTLDPGKIATVAIMGLLEADAGTASALTMKAFADEEAVAQAARVRFIHAALGWNGPPGSEGPAPSLSAQVGAALVVSDVAPTEVATPSTSPPIDALGYAESPAITFPVPIELFTEGDAQARTWTTPFFQVGLFPGTSYTAFVVSLGAGALGVAWCGAGQLDGVSPCVMETAR